jgi:hypothetical protein
VWCVGVVGSVFGVVGVCGVGVFGEVVIRLKNQQVVLEKLFGRYAFLIHFVVFKKFFGFYFCMWYVML